MVLCLVHNGLLLSQAGLQLLAGLWCQLQVVALQVGLALQRRLVGFAGSLSKPCERRVSPPPIAKQPSTA